MHDDFQPLTDFDTAFGSVQITGAGDSFVALDMPDEAAPTRADYHRVADEVMLSLSIPGLPIPSAKKQRRIARFAYLPCAHVTELAPRMAVTGVLARRGWQCVVGDAGPMALNAYGDMPPGVVMFSAAGVAEARAIYKAQSHGHQVLLHAREGVLDGNRWARELADSCVRPMLGQRARETLIARNMNEFRKRVGKLFTHVIGEMPSDETKGALHGRVDEDYESDWFALPCESSAPDLISDAFHKLWVTKQFDMPWFDVMTAWSARKGEAPVSTWGEVIPDEVVESYAASPVYALAPNVWAVRSRAVDKVAA